MALGDLYQQIQNGTLGTLRQPTSGNWFAANAPAVQPYTGGQTPLAYAQPRSGMGTLTGSTQTSTTLGAPTATDPLGAFAQSGSFSTSPSTTGTPTGGSLRDQVIAKANAIGRPDIANNPDYWVDAISSKGPNVDWGYWTDRMQTANQGSSGPSAMSSGSFSATNAQSGYGALPAGSLMSSNTTSPGSFGEPSEAQAMSSPGVQFALDEAQKAVERSAASKGTLLTGGTLKALAGYETGLAGQLYNDVFNRSLASAQFNQQTGLNNAYYGLAANNQNYNQLYNLAGLGQRAVLGA